MSLTYNNTKGMGFWDSEGGGKVTQSWGQLPLLQAAATPSPYEMTWKRPLIRWKWGGVKERGRGWKEATEIDGEKALQGVTWIRFTPRCPDCFLFLHSAATKLRIPIGRHGNARQQRRRQGLCHQVSMENERWATTQQEAMVAVVISHWVYKLHTSFHSQLTSCQKHVIQPKHICREFTKAINQSFIITCEGTATGLAVF